MKNERKTGGISRTPAQEAQFKAFQRKGAEARKGKGAMIGAGIGAAGAAGLAYQKPIGKKIGQATKYLGKKGTSSLEALKKLKNKAGKSISSSWAGTKKWAGKQGKKIGDSKAAKFVSKYAGKAGKTISKKAIGVSKFAMKHPGKAALIGTGLGAAAGLIASRKKD